MGSSSKTSMRASDSAAEERRAARRARLASVVCWMKWRRVSFAGGFIARSVSRMDAKVQRSLLNAKGRECYRCLDPAPKTAIADSQSQMAEQIADERKERWKLAAKVFDKVDDEEGVRSTPQQKTIRRPSGDSPGRKSHAPLRNLPCHL